MLNNTQKSQYLKQLFELLTIPSISTLPEHKTDVKQAALWIAEYLEGLGFGVDNIEMLFAESLNSDEHHPVLFAEKISNPDNPTVLIYGHYDVQPVDPIEEWESDPFVPEVRDEKIYARGACDNKGQLFTHLAALNELSEQWGDGEWPINVKILFEGEEEAGGENIEAIIAEHKDTDKFSADVCLVSDTPWVSADQPTLLTGLRGIVYAQIDVKLCEGDLHSGEFGGAVRNPANAVAHIISELRNEHTGKVGIPGFYDEVKEISDEERKDLLNVAESDEEFTKNAKNAVGTAGEEGYKTAERKTVRPTLDVNGIWGGFQGEGAKTIIPAQAHAKVSMRLVPNQDPQQIAEKFTDYIHQLPIVADGSIEVEVKVFHAGNWVGVDAENEYIKLASEAIEATFGKPAVLFKEGGSIPAIADIQNELGAVPVLMGYGLPDDGLHSPNEKFNVEQFYGGIECNITFLKMLAREDE